MKWKRLGLGGGMYALCDRARRGKRGNRFDEYQTWMGKNSFYKKGKNRVIPIHVLSIILCLIMGWKTPKHLLCSVRLLAIFSFTLLNVVSVLI